jgi:hypothetical protein
MDLSLKLGIVFENIRETKVGNQQAYNKDFNDLLGTINLR